MKLPDTTTIKTADQAEQLAKDWQQWQSEQALSMNDLIEWYDLFTKLGEQFNLTDEFTENGIL